MLSVMKHDVEPVLLDIADWIDETFARAAEDRNAGVATDDRPAPLTRSFSLVKASEYKDTSPERPLGSADLGAPTVADTSVDDEEDDMLSFSTKRTRQASASANLILTGRLPDNQRSFTESHARSFDSGESFNGPVTPPGYLDESRFDTIKPSKQARASYAFFTQKKAETPRIATLAGQKPRTTSPANADHAKGGLTEAELLRRRRVEAVYGMVDEPMPRYGRADDDSDDEEEKPGFRW